MHGREIDVWSLEKLGTTVQSLKCRWRVVTLCRKYPQGPINRSLVTSYFKRVSNIRFPPGYFVTSILVSEICLLYAIILAYKYSVDFMQNAAVGRIHVFPRKAYWKPIPQFNNGSISLNKKLYFILSYKTSLSEAIISYHRSVGIIDFRSSYHYILILYSITSVLLEIIMQAVGEIL
jgi:hypothetical protein